MTSSSVHALNIGVDSITMLRTCLFTGQIYCFYFQMLKDNKVTLGE
jgi:hypothetical protein